MVPRIIPCSHVSALPTTGLENSKQNLPASYEVIANCSICLHYSLARVIRWMYLIDVAFERTYILLTTLRALSELICFSGSKVEGKVQTDEYPLQNQHTLIAVWAPRLYSGEMNLALQGQIS